MGEQRERRYWAAVEVAQNIEQDLSYEMDIPVEVTFKLRPGIPAVIMRIGERGVRGEFFALPETARAMAADLVRAAEQLEDELEER